MLALAPFIESIRYVSPSGSFPLDIPLSFRATKRILDKLCGAGALPGVVGQRCLATIFLSVWP